MTVKYLLMHTFVGNDKEDVCNQINEYIEQTEKMRENIHIQEVTFSKNDGKTVAVMEYNLAD